MQNLYRAAQARMARPSHALQNKAQQWFQTQLSSGLRMS